MAPFKRSTPPAPSAAAAIRALDERLAELKERRKQVIAEIIELEANGAKPIAGDVVAPLYQDALALLAGTSPPPPPVASDNARLHGLFRERDAIDRALTLGDQQGFRLRVENRAELAHDIEQAWRKAIVRTAALLEELEQLAQERVHLMQEFAMRTGLPQHTLDCSGQAQRAAGPRIVGDAAYQFLAAARAAGFID
jgi:hypothetical protein